MKKANIIKRLFTFSRRRVSPGADPSRSWPIIIGGPHRSGTSLFRRLLNGHPNIFCPAEIKFFTDLLGQYPNDHLSHVRLGKTIESLGLPQEAWVSEMGAAFVRCYEAAARRQGKMRWADKNPDNAVNVRHWETVLNKRFFFILVVRHPFDIVASMDEIQMVKTLPVDLEGRARHVLRYLSTGYEYLQNNSGRSCLVRYEALVRDPRKVLGEVLSFIGESYDSGMVDAVFSTRHGTGLEDPKLKEYSSITTGSVDRWKSQLDDDQVRALTAVLRNICGSLGYVTER